MAAQLSRRSSLPPRSQGGPLASLRQEMEELFGRFFGDDESFLPAARSMPSIDLSETDGTVQVKMDLPGLKPEEIEIDVRGDVLTVSGERKETESRDDEHRKFHRLERRYGSFSRAVQLPVPVDDSNVEAHYRDGVLSITLPKSEEARARKIPVKG